MGEREEESANGGYDLKIERERAVESWDIFN